ncbi:hypothetical protein PHMEG_0008745 [Phytophthora megakarya]|uniref:Tf2-1-like SH3-like domain-containing protein n=1 Tax=Phytophthora megakarya TaxID=4795 RepID=A0A225WHX4_9STRA|nr:hypothetical protein PHMEG_0008745 [Phytophthora megakarya]
MEKFAVGDCVLLSTAGIQPTLVTNLGANKLAPRFMGPFKILKVLGDDYTLQLPTALRLHPTFYVGHLRRYPHTVIPSPVGTPTVLSPASLDAPAPRAEAPAPHPARDANPPSHSPVASAAPLRAVDPAPRFQRDGPAPLVDGAGRTRHIVEATLGHDDHRAVPQHARTGPGRVARDGPILPHRQYLVRWLGPMPDRWEPQAVLLEDVPDCVAAYEAAVPTAAGLARTSAASSLVLGITILVHYLFFVLRGQVVLAHLPPPVFVGSSTPAVTTPDTTPGVAHIAAVPVGVVGDVMNPLRQRAHRPRSMLCFAPLKGRDEPGGSLIVPPLHEGCPGLVELRHRHGPCCRDRFTASLAMPMEETPHLIVAQRLAKSAVVVQDPSSQLFRVRG